MAITYTWKITGIVAKNGDKVDKVLWQKIGTDGDKVGTYNGVSEFFEPVNAENFIPFSALTEEQVLAWVQSRCVGAYEQHVHEQIDIQLYGAPSVLEADALPWNVPAKKKK